MLDHSFLDSHSYLIERDWNLKLGYGFINCISYLLIRDRDVKFINCLLYSKLDFLLRHWNLKLVKFCLDLAVDQLFRVLKE